MNFKDNYCIRLTVVFLCLIATLNGLAQDSIAQPNDKAIVAKVLPLVFYTPETRWGFGGASVFTGKLDSLSKASQLQLGFAYTQNKQWLFYLPFQLWLKQNKYYVSGELGYYLYSYFFYGIGNNYDASVEELYKVNYPRVRINVQQKINKTTYFGIATSFDNWDIVETKKNGLLDAKNIVGNNGGLVFYAGPILTIDKRDQLFFPRAGYRFQTSLVYNSPLISDFEFTRFSAEWTGYKSINTNVLAVNAGFEIGVGSMPFNELGMLGGTKRLRGIYLGRFRDKSVMFSQAEFRTFTWNRFGGVVFGGFGLVGSNMDDLAMNNSRTTYGAGLRYVLDTKNHINIRFDAGFGEGSTGFYITVGEAF